MNSYYKLMTNPMSLSDPKSDDTDSVADTASSNTIMGDTYLLRQFREKNIAVEADHNVRLVDVLPTIRAATADLRQSAIDVIVALKDLMISINTKRYRGGQVEQDARLVALDKALTELHATMDAFKTDRRLALLEPYKSVLAQVDAGTMRNIPLRSLYLSFVYAANLMVVCDGVVVCAESVAATATKRTRARLWFPTGLRHLWKFLREGRSAEQEAVGEDANLEETVEAEDTRKYSKSKQSTRQDVHSVSHLQSGIRMADHLKTPCNVSQP